MYFTVIGVKSYRNHIAGIILPVWLNVTELWNKKNIYINFKKSTYKNLYSLTVTNYKGENNNESVIKYT